MLYNSPYQLVDLSKAIVQPLHNTRWGQKGISVAILRLDAIHPVISGNKWFKLQYHLQEALQQQQKGILTFGGAHSNHLVATAAAAKQAGLLSIGIVRGEEIIQLSPALQEARQYDMQLEFITRNAYADEGAVVKEMQKKYPGYMVVPPGGQSILGVKGAAGILSLVPAETYTHIACSVGTGTMMTGLIQGSSPHQQVLGFSSLRISDTAHNSMLSFIREHTQRKDFSLFYQYHFGGYARKNEQLLQFMNELYNQYQLPTDFVYTGKLLYGITDLIDKDHFPANTRLLIIHSGGLQGNRSLPAGTLRF